MLQFNRDKFYNKYRKYFENLKQYQVNGIGFLLNKFENQNQTVHIPHIAYIFATIHIETGGEYRSIYERGSKKYFEKYNGRYGNNNIDDGFKYRGRGFTQLTFKDNYEFAGKKLTAIYGKEIDLVSNPDLALDLNYSFDIILYGMVYGWFGKYKLTDYINDNQKDYFNARKIVNQLDRAKDVSDYAKSFELILDHSLLKEVSLKRVQFKRRKLLKKPIIKKIIRKPENDLEKQEYKSIKKAINNNNNSILKNEIITSHINHVDSCDIIDESKNNDEKYVDLDEVSVWSLFHLIYLKMINPFGKKDEIIKVNF